MGMRVRATSTMLTPSGEGFGASPVCLTHREETTVTCHLILTQAVQKAASGQAPIGLLVEPVPQVPSR